MITMFILLALGGVVFAVSISIHCGWSRVTTNTKKPLGWWYRKLMCEICYGLGWLTYYYQHLNKMCNKYKINLYGEKI